MKAAVHTDEFGIELCTTYEEQDNRLDLNSIEDVKEVRRACDEFINCNIPKRGFFVGYRILNNGDKAYGNINLTQSVSALSRWIHERGEEAIIEHFAVVDLKALVRMRDCINKAIEKVST